MKFIRNNSQYILTAKPFWTSHAFKMYDGRTGVARVDAYSADKRYKKRINGLLPDYTSGTTEDGYDGEFVQCMIDLSQADLDTIKTAPGYADLPDPYFCKSVETLRPKTNDPARKASSREEQQRTYDMLQNEGYDEPEFIDKTPYQKGDDIPV